MRRPLNTVWKIPRHLTSHTRAYAYFSKFLFNLNTYTTLQYKIISFRKLSFPDCVTLKLKFSIQNIRPSKHNMDKKVRKQGTTVRRGDRDEPKEPENVWREKERKGEDKQRQCCAVVAFANLSPVSPASLLTCIKVRTVT